MTPAPAPAGGSPPAATPANFFGEHVQKEGKFAEGWTESLRQAGFERLATKASLAHDEATLFKMLDDTLGFVGKKQVGAVYPKAGASDEEISNFRHDAGVPDSPDAYQLKPDVLPPGVEWSDDGIKPYAEIFHAHHVPEAAAKALIAKHIEELGAQAGTAQGEFQAKVGQYMQASEQTFQKEWGENYDTRLEANRAFVCSRFDEAELTDPVLQAALSHPKVVRMIDESRRALREGPLPGVGREVQNGSQSPRQQAYQIMAENPGWQRNADLNKRVNDLYALDAASQKR